MDSEKVKDITEKLKALKEQEASKELHNKAAERKVTDPILTEKLLINHKEKKKFSIKDLLR